MGKLMAQFETNRASEVVADANTIFPAQLIGRNSCGICLEGKIDQLIHRTQIITRILRRNIEIQMIYVDLGKGDIQPTLCLFDLDFSVTCLIELN